MNKFIIIDGNSVMNRAFYGLSGRNMLSTKDGFYTNALYGFLNILFKILNDENPSYMAVTFDLKVPTFRHKMYEGYKAQRRPMPKELVQQMPVIKDILDAMNIKRIEKEGFEADDIIGTLAKKFSSDELKAIIVSGDRDGIQLVDKNINLSFTSTKPNATEIDLYDPESVHERYGVEPIQMIDVKGLMGDTSDNVPGVPGIGEKTALGLIQQYNSIENIYENIDTLEIKDRIRNLLSENKELAFLSKKLVTINTEVPLDVTLDEFKRQEFDTEKLMPLLQKLEFNSVIAKLGGVAGGELEPINIKFEILNTAEEFLKIEKDIVKAKKLAYYPVPNSEKKITGLALCYDNQKAFYLINGIEATKAIFENEQIEKYGFNIKTDLHLLDKIGIKPKGIAFDVMLGEYILNPQNISDDVSVIIRDRLSKITKPKKELFAEVEDLYGKTENVQMNLFGPIEEKPKQIDENTINDIAKTATEYCYSIFELTNKLRDELEKNEQTDLYYNIELPLVNVLYDMECEGFKVDRAELERLGTEFEKRLAELTEDITKMAGEEFNINSTKQLGVILFEKLGLPVKRKTKTGYSTDVEVLEELYNEHPIIALLLEYRQLSKLKSTYIDGMKELINQKTSRIYSTFNQTVTTTGRISSTEPNLQNIPVKYEMGKMIRKAFIPSENCVLISADYSQIELRVLAHITNDENMIVAFQNKTDIHRSTAAKIFKCMPSEVTSTMRSSAKAINFGIIYGKGDYSLAKDLHITRKQAKEYIDEYLNQYENVRKYMVDIVQTAKEKGYVSTLFGRRRYLKDINSSNFNIRSSAERMALNAPIQGTAADIIKIAMIKVDNELKRRNLKSKLILQVHDELIIDTAIDEQEEVKALLKDCMENAFKAKVPLDVGIGLGQNWLEAK